MKTQNLIQTNEEFLLNFYREYLRNARKSVKQISSDNPMLKSHWEGKVEAYQNIVSSLQMVVN